MMKKLTVFIYLLICSYWGSAQYYPESYVKWSLYANSSSKWPDKEEINTYRKSTVIFVEASMPEYNERSAKKIENYEENLEKRRGFVRMYNQALKDSIAFKYYPYKNRFKVKSQKEFDKMKKNKKGKPYAYVVYNNDCFLFGLSNNKKKSLFYLPFSRALKREPNIEAFFQFAFHRLENFFKRMEMGGRSNRKAYNACKQELREKLSKDLSKKVILINKEDVDESLNPNDIGELDFKYKFVDEEEINRAILSKDTTYWYLRILPYMSFQHTKFREHNNNVVSRTKSQYNAGAHYIVDPIDGSAVLVNFNSSTTINDFKLRSYNRQLKNTKVSLRGR